MSVAAAGRFGDLGPRLVSALVLLVVLGTAIWLGGAAMQLMAGAVTGLCMWELGRLLSRGRAPMPELVSLGLLAGLAVAVSPLLPAPALPAVLAAPAVAGAGVVRHDRAVFVGYGLMLMAAGAELVWLRLHGGLAAALWLVAVVVAADIAAYFGGRLIGGPKFWPQVSPKKTWAGIICGWAAAALAGVALAPALGAPALALGLLSAVLALASQLGDILESALKRRVGVKDSSSLIPGHGGFLDRFDGFAGALLATWLAQLVLGLPAVG